MCFIRVLSLYVSNKITTKLPVDTSISSIHPGDSVLHPWFEPGGRNRKARFFGDITTVSKGSKNFPAKNLCNSKVTHTFV